MSSVQVSHNTQSDRLLQVLSAYDRHLVVMHDNPDPDAIGTGWAISYLIQEKLNRPVNLVAGGAIVRAENRHLVELLHPPLELVDCLNVSPNTSTILVDCSIGASNHLLTAAEIQPVAVIDHHPHQADSLQVRFSDIRTDATASASIAADYLREQGIEPGLKLATALLYAIRSETRGNQFEFSQLDREILTWLTRQASPVLLAEIESAPLSRNYFADLVLAIQSTFIYDATAFCLLPRAAGAEIVGEVADLLVRCEGVDRVFCGAVVGSDLLVSVRTTSGDENAALLLQRTLAGLGGGGGHAHRAGGKVAGIGLGEKAEHDLQDKLCRRWLAACGVARHRGQRLVSRREIIENL